MGNKTICFGVCLLVLALLACNARVGDKAHDAVCDAAAEVLPDSVAEDMSAPIAAQDADYELYAMLGKCAEMVYFVDRAGLSNGDSLRREELMCQLVEAGVTPVEMWSTPAAGEIASVTEAARRGTKGFKVAGYYNDKLNACILAFAGTEPQAADLITDIDGAFSIDEPQNVAALAVVKQVSDLLRANDEECKLLLTGHSLGGRLASIGAILYGVDAVVYNPANIPIDLHKQMLDNPELAESAEKHLRRVHSTADELTAAMNIGNSVRGMVPLVSSLMKSGTEWLADTTSLRTVKSVVSALPEIADVADAVMNMFSSGDAAGHDEEDSKTRIAVALIKNMRRYNINANDLQNPLFYRYAGRRVTPTPAHGPHAIAPLNAALDSVNQRARR